MGIIDRIKRKLPIVGGAPAGSPSPRSTPAPQSARPVARREEEEPTARSPRGDAPVAQYIEETVKKNPVVLFMKGSPVSPQCGFSANAVGILSEYGKPFAHVDVLSDPEVRDGVKQFSSWPTIPQVFIGGEFVGGSDILMELHKSGELKGLLAKAHTPS